MNDYENERNYDWANCTDGGINGEWYDDPYEYDEQFIAENEMIDMLLANRRLLDKALPYLTPDIEMDFAVALDNAFIDSLVDRVEAKSGKDLSYVERIELENVVLCALIEGYEENE